MDFKEEIDEAINLGFDHFKGFIQRKQNAEPDFLRHYFWVKPNGEQVTVLTYLINVYEEKKLSSEIEEEKNHAFSLINMITHVAVLSDINQGAPIHKAINEKKLKLAYHLLKNETLKLNLNARDSDGDLLISLALKTRNTQLLEVILKKSINIHEVNRMHPDFGAVQPFHQAVMLNYPDGIGLLADKGAQLDSPVGTMRDTPLHLAAYLKRIEALNALLDLPVEKLGLDLENARFYPNTQTGHTAIEELCEHLIKEPKNHKLIFGIAMLLCQGAEPPRNQLMRHLLNANRITLLNSVNDYLKDKKHLVDSFVNRCHLKESVLHTIIYADHSWGSAMRHLFGMPSTAALMVEDLIIRKDNNFIDPDPESVLIEASEPLSVKDNPVKLYAEFVRRYTEAYESQRIPNRWSNMRGMIARGCDWQTVTDYAARHPSSRTAIIWNEMFRVVPEIHSEISPFSLSSV
ncbi:MAG: ankyrin repeat domain-containing protein [Legionella sp.]|nr:ankyrin repeat domain-containing protein [Legionella sp.]